jgi:hypothetical protein
VVVVVRDHVVISARGESSLLIRLLLGCHGDSHVGQRMQRGVSGVYVHVGIGVANF